MIGSRGKTLVALGLALFAARGARASIITGDALVPMMPLCRAADTRGPDAPALAPGEKRFFTLAPGVCGVPVATAHEVAINITVVNPAGSGDAQIFAGDALTPPTSVINWSAGQTRASNTIVKLASDGSGTVALVNASNGTANFLIDITGYFITACVAINFSTTNVNPLCNGGSTGSITFSASGGTGALSYSINGGGTFQASNAFPGLPAAVYNLVVRDSTGCTQTGTATVTDPAAITFTTTNVNPNPPGSSTGSITFNASGGTGALSYSINGGGTFQASNAFPNLPAGTYNLVVKDANACTKTGSATLTDLPVAVNDAYGTPVNTTLRVFEVKVHVVNNDYTDTGIGGVHFDPTIHVGDKVTWVWDQGTHTSTSGGPTEIWDSGSLTVGATFSHTFTNVGDWAYGSTGEPSMTGIIHVVAGARPGVLANDTLGGGSIASYGATVGNEQTTIGSPTPTSAGGTVSLYASGGFLYTPPSAIFTGSDTFKYILSNAGGTSTATVTITVVDPPTAVDDAYQTAKNTVFPQIAPGVLGNDTLNTATIASYGTPNGTEQTTIGAATPTSAGGSVTLNADGSFSFTPLNNFTGSDTFKYKISNATGSSTATVTFTVVAAPVAVADSYLAGQNTPLSVLAAQGVTSNDTLNSSTIFSYGATTGGEQTTIGAPTPTSAGGSVTLNADGSFSFTPLGGFTGSDTFKYVLKNAAGTSTATVTFNVVPPPVAVADAYFVPSNTTTNKNAAAGVLANDTVNSATVVSYGTPTGTEQTTIGAATPTSAGGSVTLNADGSFSYTPPALFTGPDTFKYKIQNPAGSSTATVTLTVLDPPNAVNDSHAVTGNVAIAPAAPGVRGNDTGTSTSIISYGSPNGTEQSSIGSPTGTSAGGTITLNADGSYSYAPPANFTGADTFKYRIDNALNTPSTGTVTLNVSSRIMFVSSAGVGNCKPASTCALSTAGAAAAVSSGKDLIFALSGSYSSAAITLKSGQTIVGQQVSFAQALLDAGITLAADSESIVIGASSTPTLSNAGNVLTLGGGNLIEFFNINPSAGAGIFGNNTVTGTTTVNSVVMNPSGTANGVSLNIQVAGHTFNYNSGSITSTSSGAAVLMSGASGAGPATFAIDISQSNGKPIDISSRTGGTVAFNGTVGSTGQGISLTNNTGSTINFTNTLTLNTGANAAFTATGGGTVTANAAGSTLATTTATALNVANTTIGGAGLTFRSIAANGAANGIILNTTGAGGLTVTGTGATGGSGGTIQSITARGASFISANNISLSNMNFTNVGTTNGADPTISTSGCGDLAPGTGNNLSCNAGIHLQSVTGATLTNLTMNGGKQVGINGNSVTNFVLSNSSVQAFGDEVREDGLKFKNMLGTSSITNTTFGGNTAATDNAAVQIHIENDTGAVGTSITLDNVNVQSRGFAASGVTWSHGLQFSTHTTGNAKLVVKNSTFNNLFSNSIDAGSDSTGVMEVTINNDIFTNVGASGINLVQQNNGAAGTVRFNIHDNGTVLAPTFLRGINTGASHSININQADDLTHTTGGVLEGAITNNHIGDNSSSHSANSGGDGISVLSIAPGTLTILISGNTVQNVGSNGINVQMSEEPNAVHRLNATILNNSGKVTDVNSFDGIRVVAGASSASGGDAGIFCAEINGNTGDSASGNDFTVRQRFSTTFQLRGYTGGSTDTAAVQTHLDVSQANNAVHNVWFITTQAPGGGFVNTPGGGQCSQPTLPSP